MNSDNTTRPTLSQNAMKVLEHRYLLHHNGVGETPVQLFRRVATTIASAELKWGSKAEALKWEQEFFDILTRLLFLPNSPALMNAGTALNQLSACFVLPVEDNLEQIFTSLKNAAVIQQSGGGTGFNFSLLRQKDAPLTAVEGAAAGPVSFMKVFDAATEYVKHGGKRRGANMGILNIDHPDIEIFINAKNERNTLTNFNISVGISDAFMEAVEQKAEWDLINPATKSVVKKVNALTLWNRITRAAWQTGDPGLIFLDTINSVNPTPALGNIISTNPCGEVPLLPYESCNLGSINLTKFLLEENGCKKVNWVMLEKTVRTAVRFLDNVVEINHYPLPETEMISRANRKIGLGVMGWAELLILLEIPYASEAAIALAKRLMKFIQLKAREASAELGISRGVFTNWKKSIYYPATRMRNATTTSIAPTGTISIIAGTSSSIEPLFALAFRREHVLEGETLFSVNELFINYLIKHQLYSAKIIDQVMKDGVALAVKELPERVKDIFKTALEISPAWHLRHQLAFQQYTDNAVSKTINLPETASVKDVEAVYKLAWLLKAKGVTIFRNGSKEKQVLHAGIRSVQKACKVCIE